MLSNGREEIPALWNRIQAEYDVCTGCMVAAGESVAITLPVLRAKYNRL